MKTFEIWTETTVPPHKDDPWEAWEKWYSEMEPLILRGSLEELGKTGSLTIRGMGQRAGVSEGYAAFLVREFMKRHKDATHDQKAAELSQRERDASKAAETDEYLYHVTTRRRLPLIRKNGLSPNAPSQFENYSGYSKGKVFFCEKRGISFWKQRVEEHEDANQDKASRIVLLRVRRGLVGDGVADDGPRPAGARSASYYVTQKVPAKAVEVVG